jgi:hypothetical protein
MFFASMIQNGSFQMGNAPTPPPPTMDELKRREQECVIKNLEAKSNWRMLAFWIRPALLGAWVPLVTGIFGLGVTWFSSKDALDQAQRERQQLKEDNNQLRADQTPLRLQNTILASDADRLKSQTEQLGKEKDKVQADLMRLRKDGTAIMAELHNNIAAIKLAADEKQGHLKNLIDKLNNNAKLQPGDIFAETQKIRDDLAAIQQSLNKSQDTLKQYEKEFDDRP